jgi:hypothetical protein
MGFIGAAIGVGASLLGAGAQKKAAKKAANAQTQAAELAIGEQRRQFDATQATLAPYVDAGRSGLSAQQNLVGLNGTANQQESINALLASPQYSSLVTGGEEAILQNASATGGLRGGNVQNSLSRYRGDVIAQLIESQFQKLGGIANTGLGAASTLGNFGAQNASNIGNLQTQQGQARAGQALASGAANAGLFNSLGSIAGTLVGGGANFGGLSGILRGGGSTGGYTGQDIIVNPNALPGNIGGFLGKGF